MLARSSGPAIVTPSTSNVSPGRVSSQLPPVSAARSTSTLPGFIPATIAAVMIFGAGRPGTAAVQTITSMVLRCSPRRRCCSARSSSVSWRAYPPSPAALTPRSRNLPPSDSICSRVSGRTSKPSTCAPRRRAVAIACRPATPAPTIKTFDGRIVPAAVVSIGKKRGVNCAAISTAL